MDEIDLQEQHKEAFETKLQQPASEASGELDKIKYSYDFRQITDYIGMDYESARKRVDEIDYLWEWARSKSKSDDIVDALYEIKQLRDKLGFQEIGETALKKLYSYLRLSEEQSKVFDQLKRIKKEKELI